MDCLALFDIGTDKTFEEGHRIVCYKLVEYIRESPSEKRAQLLHGTSRRVNTRFVTDTSRSRIRYVAGYCVAKLRKKKKNRKTSKVNHIYKL